MLGVDEFIKFIKWLINYVDEENIDELFVIMDQDKDGVLNYQEFKAGFKKLMEITRIRNVMKEIKTIKDEPKPEIKEKKKKMKKMKKTTKKKMKIIKKIIKKIKNILYLFHKINIKNY